VAKYKTYSRIQITGHAEYIAGVTGCLDAIDSIPDGRRLLEALCATRHTVTIEDTNTGNACGAQSWSAFPVMSIALKDDKAGNFKSELNVAIDKAKRGGLTLEHLGRQLAMGLTPATYVGAANVVRPGQKAPAAPDASAHDVMLQAGVQTGVAVKMLQDLMAGKSTLLDLPADWKYELPRLLRRYLTPGPGSDSTVSFNHAKTFHCVGDPAMHQRPPAIGLAHELIHALHNSTGMNLSLVKKNEENIEELITTGIAPYNFEDLSDNKIRTGWPKMQELRTSY
jgi:hypothetical protein